MCVFLYKHVQWSSVCLLRPLIWQTRRCRWCVGWRLLPTAGTFPHCSPKTLQPPLGSGLDGSSWRNTPRNVGKGRKLEKKHALLSLVNNLDFISSFKIYNKLHFNGRIKVTLHWFTLHFDGTHLALILRLGGGHPAWLAAADRITVSHRWNTVSVCSSLKGALALCHLSFYSLESNKK